MMQLPIEHTVVKLALLITTRILLCTIIELDCSKLMVSVVNQEFQSLVRVQVYPLGRLLPESTCYRDGALALAKTPIAVVGPAFLEARG